MKKPKPRKPGKKKRHVPEPTHREKLRLERTPQRITPTLGMSSGMLLAAALAGALKSRS